MVFYFRNVRRKDGRECSTLHLLTARSAGMRSQSFAIATRRDGWESTKFRLLAVRSLDMLIAVAQTVRGRDGREVAMLPC